MTHPSSLAVRRVSLLGLVTLVGAAAWFLMSFTGHHPIDAAASKHEAIEFTLAPNKGQLNCFAQYPNDPRRQPTATARVKRGKLNDTMVLRLDNFKPGLAFDMFTVQNSRFRADGSLDPNFKGFGLSWYQSDIEVNEHGNAHVEIKTILLDQIFGFIDPDTVLKPTNTFHVGFWFNNPADAGPCGFTGHTDFNGEHVAGPFAMISLPDAKTGLGPLCTNPNTSTNPATCNP